MAALLFTVAIAATVAPAPAPCQVPRNCGQHNNSVVCGHKFTGCEFVCGKGSDPYNVGCCHANIKTDDTCNSCVDFECKPPPPLLPAICTSPHDCNADLPAGDDCPDCKCVNGACSCADGFPGPGCKTPMCTTREDCSDHGDCSITAKGVSCTCDAGYAGDHCEAVSTWAALANTTASCVSECSYVVTKGFTTPSTGFKRMHIGDHGADVDDDNDKGGGSNPVHISIDGKGEAVIDAHGLDLIFFIHVGSTLSLTGLTLQHGKADNGFYGGGAILVYGHLDATSCSFKNNTALDNSNYGGAVFVQWTATMPSCTFSGNTAYNGGGAVYVYRSATLMDCTFAGGAGSHTDSVYNNGHGGNIIFACPKGTTGTPVVIKDLEQLEANQLPPAKEVVHCTKVPQ